MPLVYVQRYKKPSDIIVGYGTQYVDGVLTFSGSTQLVLNADVFTQTGTYVLFDYANGSFPGGQAALDSYVSGVMSDGAANLSGVQGFTDDTANSRVLLLLGSNPTNGKQFVDGDLTFTGATQLVLDASLYKTAGTYELFAVSGTVTGLSFLSCVSTQGLLCGTPFLVAGSPNLVKVTLS